MALLSVRSQTGDSREPNTIFGASPVISMMAPLGGDGGGADGECKGVCDIGDCTGNGGTPDGSKGDGDAVGVIGSGGDGDDAEEGEPITLSGQ